MLKQPTNNGLYHLQWSDMWGSILVELGVSVYLRCLWFWCKHEISQRNVL